MLPLEEVDEVIEADDLTDSNDGEAEVETVEEYGYLASVDEDEVPGCDPPPDLANQNEEPS